MEANTATDVNKTRSKARDKSATRLAILDAARRVVERSGVDGLTFSAVAAEAGFARASVYGYFRSRDDIIQCLQADSLDSVARVMAGEEGAEVKAAPEPAADALVATDELVAEVAQEPQDEPNPFEGYDPSVFDVAPSHEARAETAADATQHDAASTQEGPAAEDSSFIAEQKAQLENILNRLVPTDLENSEGSAAALSKFDRRLRVVERTLIEVQDHQQRNEKTTSSSTDSLAETLRSLQQRFEESERRQRESFAELRASSREAVRRLESLEGPNAAKLPRPSGVEPEPVVTPAASLPGEAAATPATDDIFDTPEAAAELEDGANPEHATEEIEKPQAVAENPADGAATSKSEAGYLAQARQSAKASLKVETVERKPRSWLYRIPRRYLMMTCGLMSVVVCIVGVLVVQRASALSARAENVPVAGERSGRHFAMATPLDELSALASHGNAKAQLIVGLKYLKGSDGVPKNPIAAAQWLARAAQRGEAMGQYWAGYVYQHGLGVSKDPDEALRWYEASADQGNTKAMYNLGVAYAEGWTGAKDAPEAARWFARAARLGFVDAQFNLAVLYERGEGLPPSLTDAYKWYAVAAAHGDVESKKRIEALATQLSADDLAAAQRSAMVFRPTPIVTEANTMPVLDLKRT